jgi:hypothetical protein
MKPKKGQVHAEKRKKKVASPYPNSYQGAAYILILLRLGQSLIGKFRETLLNLEHKEGISANRKEIHRKKCGCTVEVPVPIPSYN